MAGYCSFLVFLSSNLALGPEACKRSLILFENATSRVPKVIMLEQKRRHSCLLLLRGNVPYNSRAEAYALVSISVLLVFVKMRTNAIRSIIASLLQGAGCDVEAECETIRKTNIRNIKKITQIRIYNQPPSLLPKW